MKQQADHLTLNAITQIILVKVHMDQNEKLKMFGVTHVMAGNDRVGEGGQGVGIIL